MSCLGNLMVVRAREIYHLDPARVRDCLTRLRALRLDLVSARPANQRAKTISFRQHLGLKVRLTRTSISPKTQQGMSIEELKSVARRQL